MKIALVTIATGEVYRNYAHRMMDSAKQFMPLHDQFVFTDDSSLLSGWSSFPDFQTWNYIYTEAKGHPRETLMRYHTILTQRERLMKYDQIFFVDADMEFVAPVGDIFSDGLMATLHPGYVGTSGTPETRKESAAFTHKNTAYYCGGFQGGEASRYLSAARTMAEGIAFDNAENITAIWHDESHWNSYLKHFKPTKILSPSYCYPEDYDGRYGWTSEQYPPILVALDKKKRGNHPRFQ